MSRRYAIFNAADAGTSLSVEQGGQVVTTAAGSLNINRMVRGTLGVSGNSNFAEFILYGTGTVTNLVSIGIASANASLATYVGGDDHSIGYRVAEGRLRRNGADVATVTVGALGDVIGVLVVFAEFSFTVAWYLNGILLDTVTVLGDSGADPLWNVPIYFAVSLGSTAEADLVVRLNTGRQQFEFPNDASDGWWVFPALPPAVRLSDDSFVTAPNDSPANTRYFGCITETGYRVSRRMHVWPWGDGNNTSGSAVELTITDPEHAFDSLLSGQFRDEAITLLSTETTLEDAETLGELTFERCTPLDDLTKKIVGRDVLAKVESTALQRRFFRPDATAGAANRPCPLVLGACFSVPVVPFDDVNFYYMIDSVGVEQVGHVRVEGVIIPSQGSPIGYTLIQSGQTIDFTDNPEGVVTADVAVTGSAFIPTAPVDALGGTGNPFTGNVGTGDITDWDRFEDQPDLPPGTHEPFYLGSGIVSFPQKYYARSHIESTAGTLVAGTRYRWAYTLVTLPPPGPSTSSASVGLTYFDGQFGAIPGTTVNSVNFLDGNPSGNPRDYSGTFTSLLTQAPMFYFQGNELNSGSARIRDFTLIELPPIDDTEDDDAVENAIALMALPLEDMLRAILVQRGLFSESVCEFTDAAAIDTASGYVGSGYCAIQQAQARDAIEEVLDGYTASMFPDRQGVLRVKRLIAPEDVAVVDRYGELHDTRMLSDLVPRRDDAPGLTRSMGARKNELVLNDSDLNTADPDVTLRVRRKLSRTHRFIQTSGAPLASGYEQAEVAEYIGTRLVMDYDVQTEIDRICELYSVGRSFYDVQVEYLDDLEVGDVLTVFYDWYGFTEGVALLVVGIEEDRINRTMQITLWGLAPEELL